MSVYKEQTHWQDGYGARLCLALGGEEPGCCGCEDDDDEADPDAPTRRAGQSIVRVDDCKSYEPVRHRDCGE